MNYVTADASANYVTADGAACYVTADDPVTGTTLHLTIAVTGVLNVNVTATPTLSERVRAWIGAHADAWRWLDGQA
jgi:hypothetical protein